MRVLGVWPRTGSIRAKVPSACCVVSMLTSPVYSEWQRDVGGLLRPLLNGRRHLRAGHRHHYGGTGHQVNLPAAFPNRYISSLAIDPSDASGNTVYAVINGFSRHWNEGPGAGYGHVWKTTDGGTTWTDISGDPTATDSFPDAPANAALITKNGTLVVATALGVFTSTPAGPWARLGTNLPTSPAVYLSPSPDGSQV